MTEQNYFNRFPTFTPDPETTLLDNFNQLAISIGWGKKSQKFKEEKKGYLIALADTHIGNIDRARPVEKLAGLKALCVELGVSPVPTSITQCKNKLETVNVCIVDLIDSRRLGTPIKAFDSFHELQRHVKKRKHYFPKIEAKKDGILKVLLRKVNG